LQGQHGFGIREFAQGELSITSLTHNTTLRYGLLKNLEINGTLYALKESIEGPGFQSEQKGLNAVLVGLRTHLLDGEGFIPAIGFQASVLTPLQTGDYEQEKTGLAFTLLMQFTISERFSSNANLGVTWNDFDTDPEIPWVLNLCYQISPKTGAMAEIYGNLQNSYVHYDAALTYTINDDFMIDIGAGNERAAADKNWYSRVGISWRIDKHRD
jgi:hypothetical protein